MPRQIGPYKIESLLSKGGMSFLYLALTEKEEPIAVKVLVPKYAKHKEMVSRFLKEAEIIKTTNHPNIVKLYGEGVWEKGLYIAMELIRGISLRQFIEQKSLSQKRALEIVLQVGYALCHLHTHGIIHRDLKPENILITENGEIKVIDFGIAELKEDFEKDLPSSQKEKLIGTPVYMSPEQKIDPQKVSFSSDIYSLGVIAYELILGRLSHGVIHLPLLPKRLREILEKSLKTDPKERYADVVDLITDISEYVKSLEDEPGEQKEISQEMLRMIDGARSLLVPQKKKSWNQIETGFSYHFGENSLDGIYVDAFLLNDSFAFAIAECDVTPSLLSMVSFRSMLRALIDPLQKGKKEEHPLQMVQALNRALFDDPLHQKFSLALLFLFPEKDRLSFISCGSAKLIHIPEGGTKWRLLATPNPKLGTNRESIFLETVDNWNPSDLILLHSLSIQEPKNRESLSLQHMAEKLVESSLHKRPSAALSILRT